MRYLLDVLGLFLARAENSYLAFEEACNTRKAKEARNKKNANRIIGGTSSGLALGAGIALIASAAVATGGIGAVAAGAVVGVVGVVGAATTHSVVCDFARSEASFRSIQRNFDDLLQFAFKLQKGVARVHTNLKSISTMADTIAQCARNGSDCSLVQEALNRLNELEVCKESHVATSMCRDSVNGTIKALKQNT